MIDPSPQYEVQFLKNLAAINRRIRAVYDKSIHEIELSIRVIKSNGRPFNLSDYPALKKRIDAITGQMHTSIYTINLNGIKESWDLSNKKNNIIVDRRLVGKFIPKRVRQVLYDPNSRALNQFMKRKDKGLDLSERVWNLLASFKNEMEQVIGIGIGEGKPAAEIARDAKKFLDDPDKLFRRVRGEDGKLHLSARARNFHPGQGVYRSSYKNALRLTRTENNMAYRTADHHRWNTMPFIVGVEVKLSKNHPRYDICDLVAGKYPKDFLFRGWHPNCICYEVPVFASDKDFESMEDDLLAGREISTTPKNMISKPPASFVKYLNDNKKRIKGWKNTPYWVKDNPDFTSVLSD
jgi:hypothetical protein